MDQDSSKLKIMNPTFQRTINSQISCSGIGLHSGKKVMMTLKPAAVNTGIRFIRSDIKDKNNQIIANYLNVSATNLGTVISNQDEVQVSTIEHLMAAIWGCRIDNLIVEIDGPEIPIMDGSSAPFVFLIECTGRRDQDKEKKIVKITKDFSFIDGDKFINISPSNNFYLSLEINFNHNYLKKQKFDYDSNIHSFKSDICRARTFCFKNEIDQMHKMGLAKGGSLDNAIVIDDNDIVNEEPLRYSDEFIRHKILDFIGDIYLSGYEIKGKFTASKTGHTLNNKMLRKLFSSKEYYQIV